MIEDAHINLKVIVDKIDSSYYEEVLPEEIDLILNRAYLALIKRHYGENNIYKKGFERSQKRTDDLKNLVKTNYCEFQLLDYFENGENVYKINIDTLYEDKELVTESDDEYMIFIKALSVIQSGVCSKTSDVKLIQQDDLTTLLSDPFNNPSKSKPAIFFENGSIYLWSGDKTLNNFKVTYIKLPKKVNIGTYGTPKQEFEVSPHLVDEIVVDASQIIIEIIESQRVNSNTQNLQLKE
jgi:hypothetical protein